MEPEFWHGTMSIKNISRTGDIVEREVVIAFRNSKCREVVKLDNKKSINVEIIQGPIRGRKQLHSKLTKIVPQELMWNGISR